MITEREYELSTFLAEASALICQCDIVDFKVPSCIWYLVASVKCPVTCLVQFITNTVYFNFTIKKLN